MAKRDSNFNPIGPRRSIRRNQGGTADWGSADSDAIRDAIAAASIVGGALRFGYSRDGGAYAVGIYGDGEPYTEFIPPSEDIDTWLTWCKEYFDDLRDTPKPTPKRSQGGTTASPGDEIPH